MIDPELKVILESVTGITRRARNEANTDPRLTRMDPGTALEIKRSIATTVTKLEEAEMWFQKYLDLTS